mmetsp:Transcript_51891/g.118283  ORF Transcript_51891/g.118283 Transcript_51891/m.118283 type:complete len:320 (+) Transcript_51891:1407-2366(+)
MKSPPSSTSCSFFSTWDPNSARLRCSYAVFFQAVFCAMLIVDFVLNFMAEESKGFTVFQWICFAVCWGAPALNLWWLIPKVVSKLCIVTSVEYMKDVHTIREVIYEAKHDQMKDTLAMLRVGLLNTRIAQYTGAKQDGIKNWKRERLDDAQFDQLILDFGEKFTPSRQQAIEKSFKLFDEDNSGSIDVNELQRVLDSMGVHPDKRAEPMRLVRFVVRDRNRTEINLKEFQALMAVALGPGSKEAAEEDYRSFFKEFDDDASGEASIEEICDKFRNMGVPITSDHIVDTVYSCFHTLKDSLTEEEFVTWMRHIEDATGCE